MIDSALSSFEDPWSLRLLDSVIRSWIVLSTLAVLRCAETIVSSAQNDPLGREKLFKLVVLLLGQHGQNLWEVSPLSCHCTDSLTEDCEFILFDQRSLYQICDYSKLELIFVFII